MSMKNQLKKSLPNLPLILRGGMEGIKLLFMALVLKMSLIIPAQATTCTVPPTCQQMGYTMKKADCGENPVLRCPFALSDDNQVFCGGGSGTADEVVQDVSVGAIVYGDGTVASGVVTGKTPIGVVFDTANRLAVALTDVKKDGTAGEETMDWSDNEYDIVSLTNCNMLLSSGFVDITCGVDGRDNTNKILACGSGCGGTPAATAVNNYEPTGCSNDFCKKTKWFLPSMRDLVNMRKAETVQPLEKTLKLLSGFGAKVFTDAFYWSSTENDETIVWRLDWVRYFRGNGIKSVGNDTYVRPVVKF